MNGALRQAVRHPHHLVLLGGDIYTAYTFIAVPRSRLEPARWLFFAVPYTIIIYPILFIVFPRLWYVSRKHGYVTAADFVRGALAIAGLHSPSPSPA